MVFLYKHTKPTINDIVLAKITEINKFNVVASLVDYDNLVGYISYLELSKKRRYKLNKIIHIGKEVIVQVTGFNTIKNFAELSIRAVNETDIENFNKSHRTSLTLYNLWRYIYMKLNPEINMDISKINSEDINNFMNKTLWKIEESLEANLNDSESESESESESGSRPNTKSNIVDNSNSIFDDLYNNLINHSKNSELIKYIEDYDPVLIKNILDSYAQIKIVLVKQTKYQEFNAHSYEIEGLVDIKKSLDYKSYKKYSELEEKYDISILYLSGGKYSLTVKQKIPMEEDITDIFDYLIGEIKSHCESNNVMFSV